MKNLKTFEAFSIVEKKATKEKNEDKKEDKKEDKASKISAEDLKVLTPKQQKAKVPDGMKKHWIKAAKKKAKSTKEDK